MDLTKYHFLFNAACYFAANEKYPDGFFDVCYKNNSEGLEVLCWLLQEMSEQGELYRRYMGYDPEETLKADEAMLMMRPKDINIGRGIVMAAMEAGFNNNNADEEVDLVLVELQKKTKSST